MSKENKNEKKEKIMKEYKKLKLIKFASMLPLVATYIIIPSAVTQALMHFSAALAIIGGAGTGVIVMFGLTIPYVNIFGKREDSLLNLLEKIKLQEEYEKLKDEDKEMVKEITKEKEIVNSDFNIDLNTNLTEEQQDLLLSASLNKDVKKYLNVVRNSLIKSEICDYDFDKDKLDKEYNEVMSSKKLVKRKNK